jgi:hypothetical protein
VTRLEVAPRAEAQIRRISEWWRAHRPAASELFAHELVGALEGVVQAPTSGVRYGERRAPPSSACSSGGGATTCTSLATPRPTSSQCARSGAVARVAGERVFGGQPRVYRFALEPQDAEDALVNPPQWLLAHEALKALDAERELPQRRKRATPAARSSTASRATCRPMPKASTTSRTVRPTAETKTGNASKWRVMRICAANSGRPRWLGVPPPERVSRASAASSSSTPAGATSRPATSSDCATLPCGPTPRRSLPGPPSNTRRSDTSAASCAPLSATPSGSNRR